MSHSHVLRRRQLETELSALREQLIEVERKREALAREVVALRSVEEKLLEVARVFDQGTLTVRPPENEPWE